MHVIKLLKFHWILALQGNMHYILYKSKFDIVFLMFENWVNVWTWQMKRAAWIDKQILRCILYVFCKKKSFNEWTDFVTYLYFLSLFYFLLMWLYNLVFKVNQQT